ncbi:MAG: hypothetical protein ISS57_15610 [Anaerolineales bacterium]|nr:hypothetical protein [Anaerolineales bacterium]
MGRYDRYTKRDVEEQKGLHPIWRGIGCIMIILMPVMAYAGAVELVKANYQNGWVLMPAELASTVTIPYVGSIHNLYAYIAVGLILLVIGFGILTILYSIMYSALGPPKYGPTDAPPPRRPKRRRR